MIPVDQTIAVSPGQMLDGKVTLRANNVYPKEWIAPLIWTPSWGNASSSWRPISSWLPTGQSIRTTSIRLAAPAQPGTYYIIFAFSCELSGDQVASATDWQSGPAIWGDGNDLTGWNATQIAQARGMGFVRCTWMNADGRYGLSETAADAIEVVVTTDSSLLAAYGSVQPPIASWGPGYAEYPETYPQAGEELQQRIEKIGTGIFSLFYIAAIAVLGLLVLILAGLVVLILGSLTRPKTKRITWAPVKK